MKRGYWFWGLLALALVGFGGCGASRGSQPTPQAAKKLIETGWDTPRPAFLRANLPKMQDKPFDGLVVRPSAPLEVFSKTPHPDSSFAADRRDLAGLLWGRFTDNFLIVWSGIEEDWDWFNPAHWEASLQNLRRQAQSAKIGGFKGLLFDAEPYSGNPWMYAQQASHSSQSFTAFRAKVRERGREFMQVLQQEYPGVWVFGYYLLTAADGELEPNLSPEELQKRLSEDNYGLWPSFVEGMLEATPQNVRLIEGNEGSYYYLRSSQFPQANTYIRGQLSDLIDPALRQKYQAQLEVAHAIYADGVLNLWQTPRFCGYYAASSGDGLKLLEHNVYHSLQNADQYAWFYSENPDWWNVKGKGTALPAGMEAAVRSAKDKLGKGQSLGLDMGFVDALERNCNAKVAVGGDLKQSDKGVEGVAFEITLNGKAVPDNYCTTWNANRRYSCVFPGGSSFTVTPRRDGLTFSPPSRSYTSLGKDDWSAHFEGR